MTRPSWSACQQGLWPHQKLPETYSPLKEEVNQNFKKDRLESEPRTVKFHEKMKKQNLKTFWTSKQNTLVTKHKTSSSKHRNLFGHMIIVAQSRQLQIRDVLAHPLGPLPWVLAKGDGSLRKTNKAALARE